MLDVVCAAEQASHESVHNGGLAADGERVDTWKRLVGTSGRLRPSQVDAWYDWRCLSIISHHFHRHISSFPHLVFLSSLHSYHHYHHWQHSQVSLSHGIAPCPHFNCPMPQVCWRRARILTDLLPPAVTRGPDLCLMCIMFVDRVMQCMAWFVRTASDRWVVWPDSFCNVIHDGVTFNNISDYQTNWLYLALRSSGPCQDNGQQDFAICSCL